MSKKAKLNEKFKGDYLAMNTVEKLVNERNPKATKNLLPQGFVVC